jgi:hypothetical protein
MVRALEDRSALVRAYAAWGLGELRAKRFEDRLLSRLRRERQDIAKSGIYEALYALTQDLEFAEGVVSILLNSGDHRARAFASNSLVGIADARTTRMAVTALTEAIRSEKAPGIRKTLKGNLAQLRG